MTVDYALQMKEIQRAVLAQAEVTKSFWNDEVARRYFEKYVDCYEKDINIYLNGGGEIVGKGLLDLQEFFEKKMEEMSQLSGCPNPNGYRGEDVHDEYLNRKDKPLSKGEYSPDFIDKEAVNDIEYNRNYNDVH